MSFTCLLLVIIAIWILRRIFQKKVVDLKDKKVLITGAASGIGRMLAGDMIKKGAVVILWDINEAMLKETVEELKGIDSECHVYSYVVDLSSCEKIKEVAAHVKKDVGSIDVLVNNAGIVTGKSLFDSSEKQINLIMDVNTNSHFWTIREFVPDMLKRNSGSIVAVSSMAGLVGTANLNDYCASKHAVVGLMESLAGQIFNEGKTGVYTTVICPYYIDTGMFAGVNPGVLPLLTPRYVVNKMMHGIEYGEHVVTCPGFLGKLVYYILCKNVNDFLMDTYSLPSSSQCSFSRSLGILLNSSMNHFTGRNKKQN